MNVDERLGVATRALDDRLVVELSGELDLAGAPLFARELERLELQSGQVVVLDIEQLDFIDSAGLRVILAAHERVLANGGELVRTAGRPQVQRLLEVAGVEAHLRTVDPDGPEIVPEPGDGSAG
jgi:anti-anti-sigma factor